MNQIATPDQLDGGFSLDMVDEGPLGEWTGYYAGGQRPEPARVMRIRPWL